MAPTVNHADNPEADTRTDTHSDTMQQKRDAAEKTKHSRSENELESSQDKNPIPPDSTRR